MAISRRDAPQGVTAILAGSVQRLHGAALARVQGQGAPAAFAPPMPLYSALVSEVDRFMDLGKLTQFGWRSVVMDAHGRPSFADVETMKSGRPEFASLIQGPQVEALLEAAALAEDREANIDGELRVLEAPQLRVAALWLSGPHPAVIPFAGLATEVLTEREFVDRMADRAIEYRRAFPQPEAKTRTPGALSDLAQRLLKTIKRTRNDDEGTPV